MKTMTRSLSGLLASFVLLAGCRAAAAPKAQAVKPTAPAAAAEKPAAPAPAKVAALPQLAPIHFGEAFTFVVVGDNRGEAEGNQRPVYLEILKKINDVNPRFVFTTGDMINGYTEDEAQVRKQWAAYAQAMSALTPPTFHSPGNHDIWDEPSGRIFRELWGPTSYAIDYGCARLIALDTETDRSRLGEEQFKWLEQQITSTLDRRIFLFFHKPLFPVDGHIGNSLDTYPEERDKLHALLVAHRDRIAAVFAGHEHLYSFEERDGIKYYITGGAGANLYAPREQGGFHHFLTVRVSPAELAINLVKVGEVAPPPAALRTIKPGEILETWENRFAWGTWNDSVELSSWTTDVKSGKRSARVAFDFAQCEWPLLHGSFDTPLDVTGAGALAVDVFVPPTLGGTLSIAPNVPGKKRKEKYSAPAVALQPGWNTVRADLSSTAWLPAEARAAVKGIEWILQSESKSLSGWVAFDAFRTEGPAGAALEDWEGMLSWAAWSHATRQKGTADAVREGKAAVRMDYDLNRWARPALYAELPARWDLSNVPAMEVEAWVPADAALPLSLSFVVSAAEKHVSPPVKLKKGWNTVAVPLRKTWLPAEARKAAVEVEWLLTGEPGSKAAGWIALDKFRAAR